MVQRAKQEFEKIVEESKKDPNIVGLYLSGSRGKGKSTKHSDYDLFMVVKDGKKKEYEKKYGYIAPIRYIDVYIKTFSEFKESSKFCGEDHWNRYSFTHVKAIVDKNKKIQKLIDEKGIIPKNKERQFVAGLLDGYINYVYRSVKCFRDKNPIGARLEAAYSIPYFFDVIFGIHGRLRPYYKYMEWELTEFPLKKFPMKPKIIISNVLKILETADLKAQQRLLKAVEKSLRKEGYDKVFDSWGEGFAWMKNFKPTPSKK